MSKRLILTAHAQIRLRERHLDPAWVEDAARTDWVEPEPRDVRLRRHFRVIPQAGARILRVVCAETETTIRVVSAMFDRKARRKP